MKIRLFTTPLCLAGLMAGSLASQGATITVPGYSFEDPALPPSPGYLTTNPTGWVRSGNAGVQLYTAMLPFTNPTGLQAAWISQNASLTSAASLATITIGETYTLKVDAGSRSNYVSNNCTISLIDSLGATLATTGVLDLADTDTMFEQTVVFTATAGHPSIGNGLKIRLTNGNTGNQTIYDNVRLDVIPEPSAVLLGGLGALALLRRRRN